MKRKPHVWVIEYRGNDQRTYTHSRDHAPWFDEEIAKNYAARLTKETGMRYRARKYLRSK